MNWETFIHNLIAGQIVPVIGNDLILVEDEKGKSVPLYSYIAGELIRDLKAEDQSQGIGELALAYPNENIMLTTIAHLKQINEDRFNLDSLKKLVEITDFKFFVTTTPDDFLVETLRRSRNLKTTNQLRVINLSPDQLSDLPPSNNEVEEPQVTVFNLFGSFGNLNFPPAFDEEEMLEHFILLYENHKKPNMVKYFMEQVTNKILLFIGCDFPDWFMRFIIRIVTTQRYIKRRSDYIVWDKIDKFQKLNRFLNHFNKNIIIKEESYNKGNVYLFIKELHAKWLEVAKNKPPQYEGTVFLSYNNPDREKAESLKKLLSMKGIRHVWFDIDDMKIGKHQEEIEEEIKKCKIFIPLISNNSLTNTNSYVRTVEWRSIEGRVKADKYYGKKSFELVPIIIDDTDKKDERIPEFMKEYASWKFPQEQEKIIEEIKNTLTHSELMMKTS